VTGLVLDTDVASLGIKDRLPPRLRTRIAASLVCVSFVTIGELTRWARLHSWGRGLGGELSAAATVRGRTSPANDTWIAACCLVEGLPLAIRKVKDYAGFAEHHGLELVTG